MINIRKFGIYAVAVMSIIAMVGLVLAYDAGHAPEVDNQAVNAPEFPTIFLPVTMILAFLGITVMMKITRER